MPRASYRTLVFTPTISRHLTVGLNSAHWEAVRTLCAEGAMTKAELIRDLIDQRMTERAKRNA
jgi:hypothetical protein